MDKEGTWDLKDDVNTKWNSMANCMKIISREVFEEPKGKGPNFRKIWWWREEVQAVTKAKKKRDLKNGRMIELRKTLSITNWPIRRSKK
ncbi:hypothetical protein CsSME_00046863 [Camellia sinensis var. sinensis]